VAGERRSLQDLVRERRREIFVGRQSQIIQYQKNLELPVDDERRRFIFNIHGNAGVGKTYLTEKFRQIAEKKGALTAYIDEADDFIGMMGALAQQFRRSGAILGDLEKKIESYREKHHKLATDPSAPDGLVVFLTASALGIGRQAVPLAGNLLEAVDPKATAVQVQRFYRYLASKLGNTANVRLLLSPKEELTSAFVSELNRTANQRIALFLDAYEHNAPILDYWLHDLLAGKYGDLPAGLTITVSGQHPLDLNLWSDYLPVIADVPLKPFTIAESHQFLASMGIDDKRTVKVILHLAGGSPLLLANLAARQPENADISDPARQAVERHLKQVEDPHRRQIALTMAFPRSFNQDVLAAIAPTDKAGELFSWLCTLPFVGQGVDSAAQRGDPWAYDRDVRSAMLRLQREQAPSQWRAHHLDFADARSRFATQSDSKGATWSNPKWVDQAREEIYHLLCADPDGNLPEALASAVMAARVSAARGRQWAEVFLDAARDTGQGGKQDTDHEMLWNLGERFSAGIRGDDRTAYLTALIDMAALDEGILTGDTLTIALVERGEGHRTAHRHEKALADYNRAIDLNPNDERAITGRGHTYRAMELRDKAIADYNRAINLNPNNYQAVICRGHTYRENGQFDDALADYNRAIELNPNDGRSITRRALTLLVMKNYDAALADFNRAIELDPTNDWAIARRGLTWLNMECYTEALADLNHAIKLDPTNDHARIWRAIAYEKREQLDDSL
jgi:tetratricopeptide (TPR) repeat protein